jgi:hypothetical protein
MLTGKEVGMSYKSSKNVNSGLFLLNTFKEIYTFLEMYHSKKQKWPALPFYL